MEIMNDCGAVPLSNPRREKFCQLYSGACFGNASKAYSEAGFKPKDCNSAKADSARLMRAPAVRARVSWLRREAEAMLAIDRTRVMEIRMKCAYDQEAAWNERLTALRDIEKAMGWCAPERVEHSMAEGAVIRFVQTAQEPAAVSAPTTFAGDGEPFPTLAHVEAVAALATIDAEPAPAVGLPCPHREAEAALSEIADAHAPSIINWGRLRKRPSV
jgi:hypothetical protein